MVSNIYPDGQKLMGCNLSIKGNRRQTRFRHLGQIFYGEFDGMQEEKGIDSLLSLWLKKNEW
jgi:hypothetical protein